jgi:hypothetical protein
MQPPDLLPQNSFRPQVIDGIIVQNDPVNWEDLFGLVPYQRFASPMEAGWDALVYTRGLVQWTILEEWEWGGSIFQDRYGYFYIDPKTDREKKSVNPHQPLPSCEDVERVGYYHTHSTYSGPTDEYFTDGYSKIRGAGDLYYSRKKNWEFLLTPKGNILAYSPDIDLILTLHNAGRVFLPDFLGPVYMNK